MSMALASRMRAYNGDAFPDPFLDVATLNMPGSLRNALQWCEYIYMSHGTYRMSMERVISYFLTELDFKGKETSDDEQEKWQDFMLGDFDAMTNIQCGLRNRQCYGNAFFSLLRPFKRFLACAKCGNSWTLAEVFNNHNFRFQWSDMQFNATCPSCKYTGVFKVDDKPDDEERKLKIKHWNVHEMELLHDYLTDDVAYLWRIPEDYKQMVRKGNLFHLERVQLPVLEAIKRNQWFRFAPDAIYHMKEPTLCGIRNRGWGLPRALTNFRQIYHVQVLRRYNEAIALDYVIPFRLITPMPRPGASGSGAMSQDPTMAFNMGDFATQARAMIRRRRRDPAGWNILPFPVQYQMLGGDASKLAPVDLLNQGDERLLNDSGVPVELYKGSMTMQTAPVALRLFEATWHHMVHDANAFLRWLVRQVSQITNWEIVDATLKRVTMADDINKQMALLQLMMGQQASGTTAFKALGLDWKDEQQQLGEEALTQAKMQSKIQEEMEQTGFAQQMAKGQAGPPGAGAAPGGAAPGGGGAPPGGDPNAAAAGGGGAGPVSQWVANMGPNTPVQPQELIAAADSLAQQLLGLPESQKDSELRLLKQKNEPVHAMVRARMDQMRRDARSQGGQAVMQQAGIGGGGGGAPPA